LGLNRQKGARRDGHVGSGIVEALDHDQRAIKSPNFRHLQSGVNSGSINLGRGDVDLDRQVGIGIFVDVVRASLQGFGIGRQLFLPAWIDSPPRRIIGRP